MSTPLLRNPVIRAVPWKDLVKLRPVERCRELLLPIPFLVMALAGLELRLPVVAILGYGYFFLAGLRLVHDTFHANLGLSRWANHGLLLTLSSLMLGSMHAIRLTHLHHHRDCLGPSDVEGATARQSGLAAVLAGAAFPVTLHRAAIRLAGPGDRVWIGLELLFSLALMLVAAMGSFGWMTYHVVAMLTAQTLTGFFAVWTVHHDVDRELQVARTLRHRLKSALALGMFFHVEHHLFPRVPTCHLPTLANRVDQAVPGLADAQVY